MQIEQLHNFRNVCEVFVRGDRALFTPPHSPVERDTYKVITHSAAAGIFSSIYGKPEIDWAIMSCKVCKPIRTTPIMRNELKRKLSYGRGNKPPESIERRTSRTQRVSNILRDVAYVLRGIPVPIDPDATFKDVMKHCDIFRRRVAKGQCFHQPYLGVREFVCYFSPPTGIETPISESEGLGKMLYGLKHPARKPQDDAPPSKPVFFQANLDQGVLIYPTELFHKIQTYP